jgi:2-polyprenyl-6-methoxyphenol hydroxylase-like FAD-dependent oxidoreductase
VRDIEAPDAVPRYCGYVAWRGIMDEAELSPAFRAETFANFSFCFAPGSQFIGYPLIGRDGSVEAGRRRYSFLWYYHVEDGPDLDDVLTDAKGRTHTYSIPPPLIRPEHFRRLQEAARNDLPPQFAEVVARASTRFVQPIYDVESCRLAFGSVTLLGDAAFVARPHVGIGVLKAGQDALALADALARTGSIQEALRTYERERVPAGREAVEFGRHLGYFIEHGLASPWSHPDLDLRPEKVIEVSARPMEEVAPYWAATRRRSPAVAARITEPA